MKKILSVLLSILIIFQLLPISVNATGDLFLSDTAASGDRISDLHVYHKVGENFVELAGGESLTGTETLRMTGKFYVNREELISYDGVFYYTLPHYLDHIDVSGAEFEVTEEGLTTKVTLDAANGVAKFTFDSGWDSVLHHTEISGGFELAGEMDARGFHKGENQLVIGPNSITVTFPDDIDAQFSNVTIDKTTPQLYEPHMPGYSMSDPNYAGKSYLLYTITVTGDTDKDISDIKVVDTITNTGTGNNQAFSGTTTPYTFIGRYLAGYAGVDNTERDVMSVADVEGTQGSVVITPSHTKDSITWNIGTIPKGETRTLTYKVVVTDEYVGFKHGVSGDADGGIFKNSAEVYASTYKRDDDAAQYEPKAALSIVKKSEKPVFDATNNCYNIVYTLVAKAPADNSYTMTNVKLNDVLTPGGGIDATKVTYNKDSLRLYEGDGSEGVEGLTDITSTMPAVPVGRTKPNPEVGDRSMTVFIGDLRPGEVKTLTYIATIPVDMFLSQNNATGTLENKAEIYDDEVKSPLQYATLMDSKTIKNTINLKHWAGKIVGNVSTSGKTVNSSGGTAYYDLTGGTITSTSPVASFEVPANNIEYKIVVNQTGDWDVSGTSLYDNMTQTTSTDSVFYAGWIRVNEYSITDADREHLSGNVSDTNAYNYLNSKSPVKTVWVKAEDLKTFNFKPNQIGLDDGEYAYTLNYFTYLKDASITSVDVSNGFKLTGTVGIAGKTYSMKWGGVSVSRHITGQNDYSYEKKEWYYNPTTSADFAKGELYWVIKVDTNGKILAGAEIKDTPAASGNGANKIVDGKSVVGVYEGPDTSAFRSQFATFSDFVDSADVTELTSGYEVTYNEPTNAVVKFNSDVTIPSGKSIYIVVKTSPVSIPSDLEGVSSIVYANKAQIKTIDKSDFDNGIERTQSILTGYSMKKLTQGVYKVIDGAVTKISGENNALVTDKLNVDYISKGNFNRTGTNYTYENGIYITWQIILEDMITGKYTIKDTLPDGTVLAYVRMEQDGTGGAADKCNFNNSPRNKTLRRSTTAPEWSYTGLRTDESSIPGEKHEAASRININTSISNVFVNYYVDGQDVYLYFDDVQTGDKKVVYQVVARVTDPDVLQGGEEKEFVNTASLYSGEGVNPTPLTTKEAPVKVKTTTMTKSHATATSNKLPFTIVANPDGLDLNPIGDTITVVDEMSENLILDTSSIVIKDKNGNSLTSYDATFEKIGENHVLRLTIPDGKKYTISYTCTIYGIPGKSISLSNKSYWEGYESGSADVKEENFKFSGAVSVDTPPEIQLTKMDEHLNKLKGAEFKLYKLDQTKNDTAKTVTINTTDVTTLTPVSTKTTPESGKLSFTKSADGIEYDTIYALVESSAPEGFVLDETPMYVGIMKNYGDSVNPVYYTITNESAISGSEIQYIGNVLKVEMYNYPSTEITVTKIWDDTDNNDDIRPHDGVTLQLLADGMIVPDKTVIMRAGEEGVTESEDGNTLTYTFTNLKKYNGETEIVYTIEEVDVPTGYTDTYSDDELTVTNTHVIEHTNVHVTKIWDDGNDADGKRPADGVTLQLYADGVAVEGQIVVLNTDTAGVIESADKNEYSYTFVNLPMKKKGVDIVYSVQEVDVPEDYEEIRVNNCTIKNKYVPEKTTVEVTKIWDDGDNADGLRPSGGITLQLYADDVAVPDKTVVMKDDTQDVTENVDKSAYHYTFEDLPKHRDGGVEIVYSIREASVPNGYTATYSTDGLTVTNTHEYETVDVPVKKIWEDENNADGKRPTTGVTFQLYADGVAVHDKTHVMSSADNETSYTFTDLPKMKEGTAIKYTVHEIHVPELYTSSHDATGLVITNKYNPEKTSVEVKKIWEDGNNADGLRPTSVILQLYANEEPVKGMTVVMADTTPDVTENEDKTEYSYTFENLPKRSGGSLIKYTVREVGTTDGYTTTYSADGLIVTNTHVYETVDVPVMKIWNDGKNADGKRPTDGVTFQLYANGVEVPGKTVVMKAGETGVTKNSDNTEYSYTFKNLPKKDKGSEITYTVRETHVPEGYVSSHSENGLIITNTCPPKKTAVKVTKIWDDNKNNDGKRPTDGVVFHLLADGIDTGKYINLKDGVPEVIENSDKTEYSYTFTNLQKHRDGGIEIKYTVEELFDVDGYTTTYSADTLTVTNKHDPILTEVTVEKEWDDADNNDGKRPPEGISLQLYADGVEVAGKTVVMKAGEDGVTESGDKNTYSYTFTGLPKYSDGSEIVYTVKEVEVPEGYTATYSTDGLKVTNKHELEKVTVTVKKVWNDGGDADGIRPSSVTIKLFADGVPAKNGLGNEITAVVDGSHSWEYTFTDLPKYVSGSEIVYTIEEVPVSGYTTHITGDMTTKFVVTNIHKVTPPAPYTPPKTGVQ